VGIVLDALERSWPVTRRVLQLHEVVYRASGGRVGHRAPFIRGRFLIVEHVGARSGIRRRTPLLYAPDGDTPIVVASQGGHPRNPSWFHNLMANPDTFAQIGRERRAVHARRATAQERPELWAKAVAAWPHFDAYQARTAREIPVVLLERR
jgi:deazaflavin-dependent oxidoreductase (nitroreductase family)